MIRKYALFKAFEALRNSAGKESVRSLAKNAEIGVATAKRCLDYLLDNKIVKRDILGKLYQFQINEESVLARQIKIAMSIAEISASGLAEELVKEYPQISSIVLYGSAAKGTDTSESDTDILILSRKEIKIKPLKAEKKLQREMSIIKYTNSEWKKNADSNKAFYDRVIADGIPLYGELPMVK